MTAGELIVVLAAILLSLGFTALVVALMRVLDAIRDLRGEVADLRIENGRIVAIDGDLEAVDAEVQWLTNMTTRAEDMPGLFEHLHEKKVPVRFVEMDNETYFWGAELGDEERELLETLGYVVD